MVIAYLFLLFCGLDIWEIIVNSHEWSNIKHDQVAFLSFNGLNIPVLSGGFNGKIGYNWWIFHCHHFWLLEGYYCSMDWTYWNLLQKPWIKQYQSILSFFPMSIGWFTGTFRVEQSIFHSKIHDFQLRLRFPQQTNPLNYYV